MAAKAKKNTSTKSDVVITTDASPYFSLLTDYDIDLFKAGKHYRLYDKLGSHIVIINGAAGTYFAVWAPNASFVSVIGNFNYWNRHSHIMNIRWDGSGIWELFIPDIGQGEYYKYYIESHNGFRVEKGDPYAIHWETSPATASIVWEDNYKWNDKKWMKERPKVKWQEKAMSIYEVHIGSWRRIVEDNGRFMTYREMADTLPEYCKYMGFTHVEFMPIMEHPFYGSWGYQITGYFAPSSRYGTPQDFMYLIDQLHNFGISAILDWVPSHFPGDEHGLVYFDGTHLYEHADLNKGFHPDWKSYIFNYSRNEVRAFLISNALYWLDKFHIDGLRVDAVASMLYLDYSRKPGEWAPNEFGGRENLETVAFLKDFNDAMHTYYPDTITIAEESSAWSGVTHPTSDGGLGFDLKWMMGWMNDTLRYFSHDPIYRSYHQNVLTFNIYYTFSEKFILPLSHDEVVYGKYSLLSKMPGDEWQKFANLRLLYSYMYGHPGAKLLFMGGEFAQGHEWRHDHSLDWSENNNPQHQGIQKLLKKLNELYTNEPELHENNFSPEGFEWIDFNDANNSVISWLRKDKQGNSLVLICNFTPMVLYNYRMGVPYMGYYKEIFNSDSDEFGGSNVHNDNILQTAPISRHGKTHSLSLTLPPLGVIILKQSGSYM
ncbi:MAG TPA: 1,4-alpha-glucan branching protein GlgB [Flavipsychrobacter sp.]|nr:1,4-alpha-glucan branching protein GlgB [Flavipsychrobacter sp.]